MTEPGSMANSDSSSGTTTITMGQEQSHRRLALPVEANCGQTTSKYFQDCWYHQEGSSYNRNEVGAVCCRHNPTTLKRGASNEMRIFTAFWTLSEWWKESCRVFSFSKTPNWTLVIEQYFTWWEVDLDLLVVGVDLLCESWSCGRTPFCLSEKVP